MPGSKKVVLAPNPPKKVTPNKLIVDPVAPKDKVKPYGVANVPEMIVDPFPGPKAYAPIKKTSQVNKVYKTYK